MVQTPLKSLQGFFLMDSDDVILITSLFLDETERAAAIAMQKEAAKLRRKKKKKTASSTSLASNTFQVDRQISPNQIFCAKLHGGFSLLLFFTSRKHFCSAWIEKNQKQCRKALNLIFWCNFQQIGYRIYRIDTFQYCIYNVRYIFLYNIFD